MSTAKKTLCIATSCVLLIGIVLALAIQLWLARQALAASASAGLPSLQGAAAIEHLKQQGLYCSLDETITAARYGIKAVTEEQRSAHDSHFVANNPAQQLRAGFAPDGVELTSTARSGAWRLGLKLRSVGYGDRQLVAGDSMPTAQGDRVEYERELAAESTIKEWYVNTAEGLEQGFTLSRPPGEGRGSEPLRLTLALRGELRARAGADGQMVEFVNAAGERVLRYDHLAVWDGCGQPLAARMSVRSKELRLEVEDAAAVYPLTIDPNFTQQAYLKASNTGAEDYFGSSVAVSGDTVVVGAYFEDSAATGVNGNQADNSAFNAGAAYVFVRNGAAWTQQAYLKASNTGVEDWFGISVAVSGDTVVVGAGLEDSNATGVNGNQADDSASGSGAAYVFVRSGATWSQQAYLKASNAGAGDGFGTSVAVAGDTVVVGANGEASSATGVNGNQADNSALNAGAAYVFVRNGAVWTQQAYLKASNAGAGDSFGISVAVSGDTVAVGAYTEDSNATGVNGNQADNSALNAGAAYVFMRSGAVWTQQAYLKASNTGGVDSFGISVAVSGDTVAVGAYAEDSNATGVNGNQADDSASDSGAAYIFVRSGATWSQQAYLKASNTGSNDYFGIRVAVSGDTVVVGAILESSNATGVNGNQADNSATAAGAAYLFVRSGATWMQQAYLKASNTGLGDFFGTVAVSGDTVAVGAYAEDSNATGVNGNQADNSTTDAGAAYMFYTLPMVVTTLADEQNANGQCSLREALINANNDNQSGSTDCPAGSGVDRITFGVTGTINLAGALPGITQPLVIAGPAANLLTVRRDTGGDYRIFSFTGNSATLSGLTITNGNASGFGGGVLANGAQLAIKDCVITGNHADTGGGIAALSVGALRINRTTVSNNTAGQAGGIYSQDTDAVIQDSTISGNMSADTGGIRNRTSTMTLINATVSGNTSTSGESAISSDPSTFGFSIISLTNCTVTNNSTSSTGQPGAIWLRPSGGFHVLTLQNTIVSGNTSGGAFSDITGDADPSSSYNLIGAGGGLANGVQGNITGVFNPQLATLGNYGGPTQTHLLLAGSPARNAGVSAGAPPTDQRGYPRPVGFVVDIGAVENDVMLTISPDILPNGVFAQPYSQPLIQTGGASGTITWAVSSGTLPPNITLDPSTGLLSGTPTGSGIFNFTVVVTSQNGLAGVKDYSLVINTCPTIMVSPASLPGLTAFTFFSQQLVASGGIPSYSFAISAGALPAGVTLSSSGLLSGAPTVSGAYNFMVNAFDANGCSGLRQYSGTIATNPGLMFYPLPQPVRLLETRTGFSGCTAPGSPINAGGTLTLPAQGPCSGIPANAAAVTGNITVVPQGPGFLTLFPSLATQPTVANSNFAAGEITNNVFTVGLGAGDGAFKIFSSATTHAIVDVTGYYAPPGAGGLYFHPLPSPVRLLETRVGLNGCIATGTPLTGAGNPNADPNLDLAVQGRSPVASPCNSIPASAQVLVGNATSVQPSGSGYLTIYPSGGTRPTVASSNYAGSDVINGPFAVRLGADGKFKIYTFATTHLVVDILGYFSAEATDANGAGLLFNPLPSPVRLLETRPDFPGFPLSGCTRPNAKIPGNLAMATHTQPAAGFCGLPAIAKALVGNVSVVNSAGAGFLTLFPGNLTAAPLVATSNYPSPATFGYNRHYFVGLSPVDGTFKVLTQFTTDLILDASGYFAP